MFCALYTFLFTFSVVSSIDMSLLTHNKFRNVEGMHDVVLRHWLDRISMLKRWLKEGNFNVTSRDNILIDLNLFTGRVSKYIQEVSEKVKIIDTMPIGVLANRYLMTRDVVLSERRYDSYRRDFTVCSAENEKKTFLVVRVRDPDPNCLAVFNRTIDNKIGCLMANTCLHIALFKKGNIRICRGYDRDNFETYRLSTLDGFNQRFVLRERVFEFFCNLSNFRPLLVYKPLVYSEGFMNPFNALIQNRSPYFIFSDKGYRAVVYSQFHHEFTSLSIKIPYLRYVCNDRLFVRAKAVDDVSIFRSKRGCRRHVHYGSESMRYNVCVDHLFENWRLLIDRCPEDWYDFDRSVRTMEVSTLNVNDVTDTFWKSFVVLGRSLIDYYYARIFSDTYGTLDELLNAVHGAALTIFRWNVTRIDFIDNVYERSSRMLSAVVFKNFTDYFVHAFMVALMGTNVTETGLIYNYQVKSFSSWLAEAIVSFVRPFWDVFLEIFRVVLDITLEVFMDLAPLMSKFEKVLSSTIDRVFSLFLSILRIFFVFVLHLFVYVDSYYMFFEYLIVFFFFSRYFSTLLPPLLLTFLVLMIFGFVRFYPSPLLIVLNPQIRHLLNYSMLPFPSDYYVFVFTVSSFNSTHDQVYMDYSGTPFYYSFYLSRLPIYQPLLTALSTFNSTSFFFTFSQYMLSSRHYSVSEIYHLVLESFYDFTSSNSTSSLN
ncbi:hypothetical protein [Xingshan nematode virus 1]|uniref:hypothetical protein n=1 Tax=Xingshan nematode virus 1 TaxID=1923760 RepID=UPI000909AA94|nr:hypothetical protein [Xingshan nematode virus 1]APG77852.1 hypothetical protein [Xingshan nematode virus 1]